MKRKRTSLWAMASDGLLLFLALLSTAFGAVTAYHIEVIPSALWALALALTAGAMALVNLPRYRLPVTVGALALWGWGFWRLWEPLVWGGTRIQCNVVNTIAAKIPSVVSIAPVTELPAGVWPQVTTLWIGMVGVIYALGLGFLLCRLRRALPVLLWTLLPILPALCVTEAPDSLPMLGLLAVWLTLVLTSLTDRRDPDGAARLRPVALLCVALVLQTLCQRLPTQGTAQPLWAADLREAVINGVSRGDFSALLTRWSGWMGSGSTEYVNLLGNSPAQTGRVALRVRTSQAGKYYLRGYSADVYTGRRWEPMARAAREELEDIRDTGVEPLLMLGEKAGEESSYIYHSYRNGIFTTEQGDNSFQMTVENVAAPGGCVYYPYALKELPENARFSGDSHLERTGAVWEHTFTFYPDWESVNRYSGRDITISISSSSYSSGGRLPPERGGGDPYRDFVYAHELQVPEDLRPILEDWLRQASGNAMEGYGFTFTSLEEYARYGKGYTNWRERVQEEMYETYVALARNGSWDEAYYQALIDDLWNEGPTQEDFDGVELTEADLDYYRDWYVDMMLSMVPGYLARTTRYDRDTPAPPAGEDYVDWFLNESKQGYCMHYATAAALLLRTAGIPARYVSGYVVNVPWRSSGTEVTDYSAHAWVEVYLDNVGWYPLEVTPGFQSNAMGDIPALESGNTQASAAPRATPSPTPTPSPSVPPTVTPSAAPSAAPTPSAEPGGPAATPTPAPVSRGVWRALAAMLFVILLILGRKWLLDRRRKKLMGEDANATVLYAYICHRRLKPWGGQDSGELTALAEKARFSQHILTEAEREEALRLLREETRRVHAALPGWKKPFFTLIFGKE